jgi:hypothetical protein
MKRMISTAGLIVIPNTGHAVNLEEPAALNQHLDSFFHVVENGRWPTRDARAMEASILGKLPAGEPESLRIGAVRPPPVDPDAGDGLAVAQDEINDFLDLIGDLQHCLAHRPPDVVSDRDPADFRQALVDVQITAIPSEECKSDSARLMANRIKSIEASCSNLAAPGGRPTGVLNQGMERPPMAHSLVEPGAAILSLATVPCPSRVGGRKGAAEMARQPGRDQVPGATCSIAPISRLAAKGLCRKAMQPAL